MLCLTSNFNSPWLSVLLSAQEVDFTSMLTTMLIQSLLKSNTKFLL